MKAINVKTLSEAAQAAVLAHSAMAGYFGLARQADGKHDVLLFPSGGNPAQPPIDANTKAELVRAALTEDAGYAEVYEFSPGAARPTEPSRGAFDASVDGERQYSAAIKLYRKAAGFRPNVPQVQRMSRKAFDELDSQQRMDAIRSGVKLYDETAR